MKTLYCIKTKAIVTAMVRMAKARFASWLHTPQIMGFGKGFAG